MKINLYKSALFFIIVTVALSGCLSVREPRYYFAEEDVLENREILLTGMVLRTPLDKDLDMIAGLTNLTRLKKIIDLGGTFEDEMTLMLENNGFSLLKDPELTERKEDRFKVTLDKDLENGYWSHPATSAGPETAFDGRGFGYSPNRAIERLNDPDGIDHFFFIDVMVEKRSTFLGFGSYLRANVTLKIINRYNETVLDAQFTGMSEKQFMGTSISESNFQSALRNAFAAVGL